MTTDCSLSGYLKQFQTELTQAMKSTSIGFSENPEAIWMGQALANTIQQVSSKCISREGAPDCTPKGYAMAVITKLDPEQKIAKMAISKVEGKAIKNLGVPAKVGCAVGAIIGGAAGAIVTFPEGSILGAAIGASTGCATGAKIAPGIYHGYKVITKIKNHYNTAIEVKDALKAHSNVCRVHPLTPPDRPKPPLPSTHCQTGLVQERIHDRSLNPFTPKRPAFFPSPYSPFASYGTFPSIHYPYLHPRFNPPYAPSSYQHQPFLDRWSVQQAVKSAIESEMRSFSPNIYSAYMKACSNVGLGYLLSYSEFRSVVSSTSLIGSYNSFNSLANIRDVMNFCREIGGVGNDVSVIQDLLNSETQAEAQEYFLCFPSESFSFSPSLIKQLERELAEGYFNQKTVPFFSLHFNNDGFMYPVIHPAYQNTLTGEIIALLDYWMKGFLNGGIFDEEFLKNWHTLSNCDEMTLRSHLIDLKKYTKEHQLSYISLRELMQRYGLHEGVSDSDYKQPFITSFRIIAYQEKVERHGNLLIPYPTFRVEYSIDLMPDYQNYLEAYCREHGHYPEEYEKTRLCYELLAAEIKEKLPKMPFCRDFFKLLGMMNFFCYFYATLNQMGKKPVLEPLPPSHYYPSPKAFPPIPIRYYRNYPLPMTLKMILSQMHATQTSASIDQMFLQVFTSKRIRVLSPPLIEQIRQAVTTSIRTTLSQQIPPGEPLHEEEVEKITQVAQRTLRQLVYHQNAVFQQILNRLMLQLNEKERGDLLPLPLVDKIRQTPVILKQHLENMKQSWMALSQLTNEEILKELPPEYHQIALEGLQKTEEALRKELEEAIKLKRSTGESHLLTQIEALKKMHFEEGQKIFDSLQKQGSEEIARQITETEKAIQKKGESTKQTLLKERDDLTQVKENQKKEISSLSQMIQQLEQNKNQQINSVPVHLRGIPANQTAIANFTTRVNQQISECQQEMTAMNAHLLKLNEAITKVSNDVKELPSKIQSALANAKNEITQDIQAQVNQKIETLKKASPEELQKSVEELTQVIRQEIEDQVTTLKEALPKIIHQERLEGSLGLLEAIYQDRSERITKMEEVLSHFSQNMLTAPEIVENKICEQYTHALLGFSSPEFMNGRQERFKIMGGCGMSLPKLISKEIENGEAFYNKVISVCSTKAEEATPFLWNGASYNVFRLPVEDRSNADPRGNDALSERAWDIIEELCESDTPKKLRSAEVMQTEIDPSGAKLIHYAAALLEKNRLMLLLSSPEERHRVDKLGHLPIHVAAYAGNVDAIEALVSLDPTLLNAKAKSGASPLLLAVQYGKLDVVEKLISLGAQVNTPLPNGLSPLFVAIQNNFPEIALLFLERVPSLTLSTPLDSGVTPLHQAIDNGLPEVALKLIQKGSSLTTKRKSDGYTPWHCAASLGLLNLMQEMVAQGLSPVLALESQKTALHLAAEAGQTDVVSYLLTLGLDVNGKTSEGETSLMLAIRKGHLDVALLLAKKVSINVVNKQKQTSSLLALQYGMPLVNDILLKRGEDPSLQDQHGYNNIYYLIRNDEYDRVMLLASQKGIDLQQTFQGESLSTLAAKYGHFLLTYALLDLGIKIKSPHNHWKLIHYATMADEVDLVREWLTKHEKGKEDLNLSLAHLAAKHGSKRCLALLLTKLTSQEMTSQNLLLAALESERAEIVRMVLRRWEDVNKSLDSEGNTALHCAAQRGQISFVELLIKSGSRADLRNHAKQTPFHIALNQEDAVFLKQLLKWVPPAEWPQDLETDQPKKVSARMARALKKYQSVRPKTTSIQQPVNTPLASEKVAILSEKNKEDIQEIESLFADEAFEEVADLLEQKADLLTLFKSSGGGKLLQKLFANIYNYSTLEKAEKKLDEEQEKTLKTAISFDRLLALLQKNGVDPAIFQGLDNVLLGILKTENEEEACYRLDTFTRYFPKSLKALASDSIDIHALVLKKNMPALFKKLDGFCRQYKTEKDKATCNLHEVVLSDHYSLVEDLLKDYPVDSFNAQRQTPLMLAALKNNTRIMELLLSHGALPDSVDLQGRNALHYAVEGKAESAALFLLPILRHPNRADREGVTSLSLAAAKGLLPVVRYLSTQTIDMEKVDTMGRNALHYAALEGQVECIRYLVKKGCPIDLGEAPLLPSKIKKCLKRTPLHLAALRGQTEAVAMLLALGADPCKVDGKNNTVCEHAVLSKSVDTLRLVQQLPVYFQKERQTSLLHAATLVDNSTILRELILDEVDLNGVNKEGLTALHLAAAKGSGEAVEILVETSTVIVDMTDPQGETALHFASFYGHVRILEALIAAGAKINKVNHQGETPLFLACQQGHLGAVVALLKYKADTTLANNGGITPKQAATLKGHSKIANRII